MSQASHILIGCYRGDGGGSGNGCCGHHTHSPVKKKKLVKLKNKNKKDLPKAWDMSSQASFVTLGVTVHVMAVIIVLAVAGCVEMVVWGCGDMLTCSDRVVKE